MNFKAIIYDSFSQQWMNFEHPLQCHVAYKHNDVLAVLQEVERQSEKGRYAVGFLSYEAAPAFDPAFCTKDSTDFPLCCFAVFDHPTPFDMPDSCSYNFSLLFKKGMAPDEFARAFSKIKSYIRKGATYQVNYTHRQYYHFCGDAFSFFQAFASSQPTSYGAFIEFENRAVCSASPELFFILDGDRLVCRPMKGTAKRGDDDASDEKQKILLQNSSKDRAENVMIVDMIRNDLGRIADVGSVVVSELYAVEPYPTLWQMTSTVKAQSGAGLDTLMSALFPCASITGAPKVRTMQIIDELETQPRNIYTGTIGLIKPKRRMQFNVAIRTALIDKNSNEMVYGIGSGVVWDSDVEEEYKECKLKAKVLQHIEDDFDLLETMLLEPETGYFLLDYHIRRMRRSARYFGRHFDEARARALLQAQAKVGQKFKVRLLLAPNGDLKVEKTALPPSKAGPVMLKPAKTPVPSDNIFLHHKTTRRHIYEKARSEAAGCDDVVLWNEENQITETTIYNIVVQKGGRLLTPPLSAGLLAGAYRAWLLDRREIEEQSLSMGDLYKCDEMFVVNSVRGMQKAVLLRDE